METLITELVGRFERGALSRRQLIQGLSSLVLAASNAAASPAAAQTAASAPALKGTRIDHVSILVADMARSAAFYQSVFGLAPVSEDKEHKILRLGGARTIVSLRQEPPSGTVDHFAIAVDGFNRAAVTEALKPRGLTPQENIEYGFYINDPDGVHVQIV
jgi:catechol 2,3-dioxygenase-like lactoylglutathione lyase family enzyme